MANTLAKETSIVDVALISVRAVRHTNISLAHHLLLITGCQNIRTYLQVPFLPYKRVRLQQELGWVDHAAPQSRCTVSISWADML